MGRAIRINKSITKNKHYKVKNGLNLEHRLTAQQTIEAQTYLQPHYSNGVSSNVYLSAGQHYGVNIAGNAIAIMGVVDTFGQGVIMTRRRRNSITEPTLPPVDL